MIKVFALIPSRADITKAFFHEHWEGPHGELAKRITTLRAYVQSHRIEPGVAGLPESICEGIAEVWFDDVATAAGMGEDPNYANYALLDEPNFIDTDRLAFLLSEEQVQLAGAPIAKDDDGVKAMLLLRRADDMSPADFAEAIRAVKFTDIVGEAERVTVAVAITDMYADGGEPPFDAIVELWFGSGDGFEAAWSSSGAQVLSALDSVVKIGDCAGFLGDELRVIWS